MKKLIITAAFAFCGVFAMAQDASSSTESTGGATPMVTETKATVAGKHCAPKGGKSCCSKGAEKSCCSKGAEKSCHGKSAADGSDGSSKSTAPKSDMAEPKSESSIAQ